MAWTTHTGGSTNLYAEIDEFQPVDDTDYVQSTAGASSEAKQFQLTALAPPQSGVATIFLRLRTG
jgi:hypothetical protein